LPAQASFTFPRKAVPAWERPAFVLSDVKGADFRHIKAQRAADAPAFALKNVEDFSVQQSKGVPDTRLERVSEKKF
jgi:hypothetical protein